MTYLIRDEDEAYAATAHRRSAPRPSALTSRLTNPNPDCETCNGTGTDFAFGSECGECWRIKTRQGELVQQHLNPTIGQMMKSYHWDRNVESVRTQRQARRNRKQSKRNAWKRNHPITMAIKETIADRSRATYKHAMTHPDYR